MEVKMQLTKNPYDLKLKLVCKENITRLVAYQFTGSCFPVSMEISPTNRCNLKCSWCISKQYHRNESLGIDALVSFLRQFKQLGGKSITWSGGGEPTRYKYFIEAVWEAARLGIDQGLMTNGLFGKGALNIAGNKIKWIRVSLDTVDRQKYKDIKGVDALDKVMANIKELSVLPARLIVNMNVAKVNEDEILDVAYKAKELGASGFQLRPVLPIPSDMTTYIPPNIQEAVAGLRYLSNDDFFCNISYDKFEDMLQPREYKSCTYHNFICVLNSNGDLSVCMYRLYEDAFTFGNIYENDLKDIWVSPKRQEVIKHCTDMDFSKCQVCCKGHELNTFLYYIDSVGGFMDRRFL